MYIMCYNFVQYHRQTTTPMHLDVFFYRSKKNVNKPPHCFNNRFFQPTKRLN